MHAWFPKKVRRARDRDTIKRPKMTDFKRRAVGMGEHVGLINITKSQKHMF